MRSIIIIVVFLFLAQAVRTQSKLGFEQYSYMGAGQLNTLVPVAHYESGKKWYTEARYNYEDLQTFSLYAGKTFSRENDFSYAFTPMIGGMVGKLKGGSVGLNTAFSFRNFNFSSQSQYSVSADAQANNFFFSWSELYYQPLDWMYTGVSLQHTQVYRTNALVEPGLLIGFSFNHWTFPIYSFSPFGSERYFVVGINWEWKHLKSQHKKLDPRELTKATELVTQ